MILVFDTETTGIANFRLPPEHESQPRIVQLGAILYDDANQIAAEMNLLVKPDGFTIPVEASAIHGITTERANRYGLAIGTVIKLFSVLCARADTIIAHNLDFDRLMVISELYRASALGELKRFRDQNGFCTMKKATDICKIPGPRGYKWPNLQEAHRYFFDVGFEGAHDAMADVRACARVFFELQARAAAGGASC